MEENIKGILEQKTEIEKTHNEYKKFTGNDKMRELYESRLKRKRDDQAIIEYAKQEA